MQQKLAALVFFALAALAIIGVLHHSDPIRHVVPTVTTTTTFTEGSPTSTESIKAPAPKVTTVPSKSVGPPVGSSVPTTLPTTTSTLPYDFDHDGDHDV